MDDNDDGGFLTVRGRELLYMFTTYAIILAVLTIIGFALQSTINLTTPYLWVPVFGLFNVDVIGFDIPMVVAGFLLFYFAKTKRLKLTKMDEALALIGVAIFIVAMFTPLLNMGNAGAGFVLPLIMLAELDLFYHIYKREYGVAVPLSYVLGFLAAVGSDLVATFGVAGVRSAVWGGFGILDGDFFIPLVMMLTVLIMERIYRDGDAQHRLN